MKERLVELLGCEGSVITANDFETVADHLIKNDVIVPNEDYEKIVRCSECGNLNVIGTKELYARCEKYGFEFLPFKADTRNHFCVQYK